MKRVLLLLLLLPGCYDFADLPSLYRAGGDLSARDGAVPSDLAGADLAAIDLAIEPADLVGADLVPPPPDLTVVDLVIPPGADLATPSADLGVMADLAMADLNAPAVDLAIADLAVADLTLADLTAPAVDLAMADLAKTDLAKDDLTASAVDLAKADLATPDLAMADLTAVAVDLAIADLAKPDLAAKPDLLLPPFQSCVGLANTCGPNQNGDCCESLQVPKGTFDRGDGVVYPMAAKYPATVSNFRLDRYEVTVGRFRKFVEAGGGGLGTRQKPPTPGSGAFVDGLGDSYGWDASWNAKLLADKAELTGAKGLQCLASLQTWTAGNDTRPLNCVSWYEAFAFCAWDGGRLPTEAEWNYAAAGGSEQRPYPWSTGKMDVTIDATLASYDCQGDGSAKGDCKVTDLVPVGTLRGNGRWGHADLAGNVWEWTFDGYTAGYGGAAPPCNNCAATNPGATFRTFRGGGFAFGASNLLSWVRISDSPANHSNAVGFRCARAP